MLNSDRRFTLLVYSNTVILVRAFFVPLKLVTRSSYPWCGVCSQVMPQSASATLPFSCWTMMVFSARVCVFVVAAAAVKNLLQQTNRKSSVFVYWQRACICSTLFAVLRSGRGRGGGGGRARSITIPCVLRLVVLLI